MEHISPCGGKSSTCLLQCCRVSGKDFSGCRGRENMADVDTTGADTRTGTAPPDAHPDPHHARRWLILAVIGLAQLMIVLDVTIVNIALPDAQKALKFSNGDRQWIVTAYSLAFGSLLLLFGRVSDVIGRRMMFLIGLV